MTSPITPGPWGTIRNRWRAYEAAQGGAGTREQIEEILYDKAYSWELQPGSDVMATCVGVLPKVETYSGYDFYMGLVSVVAGSQGFSDENGGESFWALCPADTPLTWQGQHDASFQTPTAGGVYVAVRCVPEGQPPPYAFPAGWTPGNTTGSGPVQPYFGAQNDSGAYPFWAGLVTVPDTIVTTGAGGAGWYLLDAKTPLNYTALNNADWIGNGSGAPAEAGMYIALYLGLTLAGSPAPTVLPEGWTFRPYGIGPVAITDENAGGLIGDVAYVVSGYVNNGQDDAFVAATEPRWIGRLSAGVDTAVVVGDVFKSGNGGLYTVTHAGTLTGQVNGSFTPSGGATTGFYNDADYWPFIERYDLTAKKWLPRIPLPDLGEGNYFAAEGGIAGVIDGKLYFGGGDGDVAEGTEFFVYDPADDSITRLADLDADAYPDYSPYGIVDGKLWYFLGLGGQAWSYDPAGDEWVAATFTGTTGFGRAVAGDQIQGFEIDGKLWFVYAGKAYVFDPVALTVTAKATSGFSGNPGDGPVFLRDGKIWLYGRYDGVSDFGQAEVYDPVTDTWTISNVIVNYSHGYGSGEFVGVTHEATPYQLSELRSRVGSNPNANVAGVYGLTGVALDSPRPARLQDVIDIALDAAPGMRSERTGGSVLVTPAVGFGAGYLNLNEIEAALDASTVGGAMEWGTSWDGTDILFNDTEHQGLMQVIVSGLIGADDLEGTATLFLTQKNGPFFDQASFDLAEGAQGFLLSTTAAFRGTDNAFGLFYTAEDTAGSTGIVVPVFISVTIVRIR